MAGSRLSGARFVYVATAVAALGGLLFGYDTGVISGAILFIKEDFNLSPSMQELVVSAVLAGAIIGAAAAGTLADRFGRRKVIVVAAAIFAVGALGTAVAPSVGTLIAGRIVVGVAIGAASFVAPLFIAELAPARYRGRLVSVNQLALTSGIVIAYLVDYAFSASRGWRYMFGLAAIPAIILGVAMYLLPDSPRWLLSQGMAKQARAVLTRIRGTRDVGGELSSIRQSLKSEEGGWRDLLSPLIRPALVVGIGLAILQQITGINTVIYYAPTIFQFAGFAEAGFAILASLAVGVTNVLLTIVAIFLIDRVGRRPLLLISLAGMVLSLGALGLAFALSSLRGRLGLFAIGSLVLYVGFFAVGMGPIFWLMISEIFPLKARGLAMSTATVANWGANLLVSVTFLTLVAFLGKPGTFWLYAVVGIFAVVFVYLLVPETKGKTLEQIQAHWRAGKHPRELGR